MSFRSIEIYSYNQIEFENVKRVYVHNFIKYIAWPERKSEFVIGIYGTENFMKGMEAKPIGNIKISTKLVHNLESMKDCQIIYVAPSKSSELEGIKRIGIANNTLIITDEDLAEKGAGISFFLEDSKLKFKLNKQILDASNLKVSASLTGLAVVI